MQFALSDVRFQLALAGPGVFLSSSLWHSEQLFFAAVCLAEFEGVLHVRRSWQLDECSTTILGHSDAPQCRFKIRESTIGIVVCASVQPSMWLSCAL